MLTASVRAVRVRAVIKGISRCVMEVSQPSSPLALVDLSMDTEGKECHNGHTGQEYFVHVCELR